MNNSKFREFTNDLCFRGYLIHEYIHLAPVFCFYFCFFRSMGLMSCATYLSRKPQGS